MKKELMLRGARAMLFRAQQFVISDPWEPGWDYPEIDKCGNAPSTNDAITILKNKQFLLTLEIRNGLNRSRS